MSFDKNMNQGKIYFPTIIGANGGRGKAFLAPPPQIFLNHFSFETNVITFMKNKDFLCMFLTLQKKFVIS